MEGVPEFENISEKEPIKMFNEDWIKYTKKQTNDPELLQWMIEKGIKFDSGEIEIEIDGEKSKMTTRKDDFGTMLLKEDEKIIDKIIRSGIEKN